MGLRKKIKKFIYNNNINRKYGKFATDKTIKKNWNKIEVLFTALPNCEAQKIANKIPSRVKLIDLSADFRIDSKELYKTRCVKQCKASKKRWKRKIWN